MIGYVDLLPVEDLCRRVESGLAAVGFSEQIAKGTYTNPLGQSVHCSYGAPTGTQWPNSWPAWAVFPIDYADYEAYGAPLFVSVFRALCRATTPVLARSFHPIGVDMINPGELEGQVDYVDWIQYYGVRVTAALDPGRVRTAGFHHLEEFPDGAFLAMAKPEYTGDYCNRRAIVERLGLSPRRIMARNPPTGEPTEVNWCL